MENKFENNFLVVVDENGVYLPMAGIWRNNEAGRYSADKYAEKNTDIKIIAVKLEAI